HSARNSAKHPFLRDVERETLRHDRRSTHKPTRIFLLPPPTAELAYPSLPLSDGHTEGRFHVVFERLHAFWSPVRRKRPSATWRRKLWRPQDAPLFGHSSVDGILAGF